MAPPIVGPVGERTVGGRTDGERTVHQVAVDDAEFAGRPSNSASTLELSSLRPEPMMSTIRKAKPIKQTTMHATASHTVPVINPTMSSTKPTRVAASARLSTSSA